MKNIAYVNTNNELSSQSMEKANIMIKEQWSYLCSSFYNEEYSLHNPWPSQGGGAHISTNMVSEVQRSPKKKPANTFRIFLVGGSAVFGSGNNDRYTNFFGSSRKI